MPQPTQLTAIQQNARALRGNGDLAGARLMLEQGLEAAKAGLGEDHPEVLSTAHLLAGLHREAGEPAAARRVLEEAVAAGQLRYGDGEPLMLALSYTLGMVADELGNRHEARRNLGRVATAGPAVLGEDHAWVRAARGYLGADAGAGSSAPGQSPVSGSPTAQGPPAAPSPSQPNPPPPSLPPPSPPQPNPPPPSPAPPPAPPAQPRTAPPGAFGATHPQTFQPTEHQSAPPPYQPPPHQSLQVGHYPPFGSETGITATAPPSPVPTPALPARRGRGSTVAAAIAAAAAVLAATVAAVVVLTDDRASDPTPPQGQGASSSPSSTGRSAPPERVRINDDRNAVTLTWRDPSDGTAPFIVAGSRAGEQQRAMGQVPPGGTRYRLNGLNPNLDYCFVVVVVYSADLLVPSERVCTQRPSTPSADR